jgi:serine/threonine-protein kinase
MMDHGHEAAGVREGDILAGKYRIDKILGLGGMGVVVAAHHIQLDDRVAIKFLLPSALANPDAVARFAREARAAVKIRGEHVARVVDVGTLENGSPYMVMEYLEGMDLSGWLEQHGALGIEQAVEFVLQACEALAEAHVLGIVHRDLKPANLFVIRRPDGTSSVKVLDFGISKTTVRGGSKSDMTQTRAVMGSPLYMSPEQMQSSKDVDPRTDIWALGVILYELLTADSPFYADTMPELVVKILTTPPQPLRNKRPDAPASLEAVILRAVEKDRGRRYQSVGELAIALLDFAPKRSRASVERISGILKAGGLGQTAFTLPPSSESFSNRGGTGVGTAANWGRTSLTQKRATSITIVAAAIGAVVLVGATVAVLRSRQAAPVSADSAASGGPSLPTPMAPSAEPPNHDPVAPAVDTAKPGNAEKTDKSPAVTPSDKDPKATPATSAATRASATPPGKKPPGASGTPASKPVPEPAQPTPAPTPRQKPGGDWGGRL